MSEEIYELLSDAVSVTAHSLACNPSQSDRERDLYILQDILTEYLPTEG